MSENTPDTAATSANPAAMYTYDEDAAGHAEDFVNRIDKNDAYTGKFLNAWPIVSARKDDGSGETAGVHFDFEGIGKETASFDVYTIKKDGTKLFGYNMLQAMMLLMGVKGLKTKKGKIQEYEEDPATKKRKLVEKEGDVFPDLIGKPIGLIFQRELYNRQDGKEGTRVNMIASFHPETHLTASEIREKKTTPAKFKRIMDGLRTKDSRTHTAAEPAQPSQSVPTGDY